MFRRSYGPAFEESQETEKMKEKSIAIFLFVASLIETGHLKT